MIKKIEKNQDNPLVSFMKKSSNQIEKNKNLEKKPAKDLKNKDEIEDEELENAKKESRAKMSGVNKIGMYKKLFLEVFAKYCLAILLLVGFLFLIIKATPLILAFFHGLISNVIFGAIK